MCRDSLLAMQAYHALKSDLRKRAPPLASAAQRSRWLSKFPISVEYAAIVEVL